MAVYEGVILVQHMRDVLDPEGVSIEKLLKTTMGYPGVKKVICGRRYAVEFDAEDERRAYERIETMAKQLFANLTYQTYVVSVSKRAP